MSESNLVHTHDFVETTKLDEETVDKMVAVENQLNAAFAASREAVHLTQQLTWREQGLIYAQRIHSAFALASVPQGGDGSSSNNRILLATTIDMTVVHGDKWYAELEGFLEQFVDWLELVAKPFIKEIEQDEDDNGDGDAIADDGEVGDAAAAAAAAAAADSDDDSIYDTNEYEATKRMNRQVLEKMQAWLKKRNAMHDRVLTTLEWASTTKHSDMKHREMINNLLKIEAWLMDGRIALASIDFILKDALKEASGTEAQQAQIQAFLNIPDSLSQILRHGVVIVSKLTQLHHRMQPPKARGVQTELNEKRRTISSAVTASTQLAEKLGGLSRDVQTQARQALENCQAYATTYQQMQKALTVNPITNRPLFRHSIDALLIQGLKTWRLADTVRKSPEQAEEIMDELREHVKTCDAALQYILHGGHVDVKPAESNYTPRTTRIHIA
jgi:hypothetical protein